MAHTTFDEVLEAIDHLPVDEQTYLVEVVRRRLAEHGRQRIVDEVRQAEAEFYAGTTKPASVDHLMREIES